MVWKEKCEGKCYNYITMLDFSKIEKKEKVMKMTNI